MKDSALTTRDANCSWLVMTATGEKKLDVVSQSVQTRIRFGSDRELFIEITSRSRGAGELCGLEIDANLIVGHLIEHCGEMVLERASYDDAANSLRGNVVVGEAGTGYLASDQISQRRSALSSDKYRSERDCINETRDQASRLLEACENLLSRYDRRIGLKSVRR